MWGSAWFVNIDVAVLKAHMYMHGQDGIGCKVSAVKPWLSLDMIDKVQLCDLSQFALCCVHFFNDINRILVLSNACFRLLIAPFHLVFSLYLWLHWKSCVLEGSVVRLKWRCGNKRWEELHLRAKSPTSHFFMCSVLPPFSLTFFSVFSVFFLGHQDWTGSFELSLSLKWGVLIF